MIELAKTMLCEDMVLVNGYPDQTESRVVNLSEPSRFSSTPLLFFDDEPRCHDFLFHPEPGGRIVDAVPLRFVRIGVCGNVEPELLPEVASRIP